MTASTSGEALLAGLDAEQREAALLPDGPAQIIAPAGSGKTTTLIARLGVLLDRGHPAERILVLTFNRDAAGEVTKRIARRLSPIRQAARAIEVRTLHALGRQILLDAGWRGRLVTDRLSRVRAARRQAGADAADPAALPTDEQIEVHLSAFKLEQRPEPPEVTPVIAAYQSALARDGAVDFDDLIIRSVDLLTSDAVLRRRWQGRFSHVLVDEFQDVDAAQLRLIGLLSEPERNLFAVGDDDQTIYAWRLADVRRILDFGLRYPEARRVMLATNYRCPPAVVAASRRLIAVNRERFAKRITARRGAHESRDDIVVVSTERPGWPIELARLAEHHASQGSSLCFLARTRAELLPVAMGLIRAEVPHDMKEPSALETGVVDALLCDLRNDRRVPPYRQLTAARAARGWRRGSGGAALSEQDQEALDALLGWAAAYRSTSAFLADAEAARHRLTRLRRPDAAVKLMTVHAAKGLEFPVVVLLGFEEDRFPNRRALTGAADPGRALEDERRLAYVALTRASRQLVLALRPARASRFLAEMGAATAPPPAPRR